MYLRKMCVPEVSSIGGGIHKIYSRTDTCRSLRALGALTDQGGIIGGSLPKALVLD
jgi:hypothetical protein